MKQKENILYADKGKVLRRISDKWVVGPKYSLGYTYYIGGQRLPEPKLEVKEDFEELTEEEIQREKESLYPEYVEKYIRERYSHSQELAIQRQRDSKPEQFQEYFNFCEECKKIAREELGL